MMPLPLVYCVVCGSLTCVSDILVTVMTAVVVDEQFVRKVSVFVC